VGTFILTWNGDDANFKDGGGYQQVIRQTLAGIPVETDWSVGARRSGIGPGDRAFMLRQRDYRGLVGRGTVRSAPVEDRIPTEQLFTDVPTVPWNSLYGSGVEAGREAAVQLDSLWSGLLSVSLPGDEPEGGSYPEGAVVTRLVNRYERDPRARRVCLEHFGYDCTVCGMNFADRYGALGANYIHVHHLVELSSVGADYRVDPITDLRPLCPNCHAMAHQRVPAYSLQELVAHLRSCRA
jgi:5-methylcytosine-specific restriction protein A